MKSKYLELLENTLTRYQRSGFLVGDYIKIHDNYKSKRCYSKLSDEMKVRIDELAAVGANMHLRVVAIKNKYPSDQPGNEYNTSGKVVLDIGVDYGGGRFYSVTTIPSTIATVIDYGINLAPLPNALTRDNIITIKPEPVNLDSESDIYHQTRMAATGKGEGETETNLTNTHIKIPANSAKEYVKFLR